MFTRDTRTETFLKQMGVEFGFKGRISLSELVSSWRETNLSRPIPIRDEAVLEYSSLMASGSPAPAPILHNTKCGYRILDGVQRIAAAELARATELSAYIVACETGDVLAAIAMLANARLQGRAEPPEWTRRRAVEVLVIERQMSIDEVARLGGWRRTDIQAIATVLGWRNTVREIGGPELPDSLLTVLSDNVSKQDLRIAAAPAAEFLETLKAAKFSADDATPYVQEFFRPVAKDGKRFEVLTERLEKLKSDAEIQIRILGRRGAIIPQDVNLRRAMKTVVTILDEIISDGGTVLYVDEFFKLAADIEKRLHGLSPSRPKAATVRVPADMFTGKAK